ncbi:MAG: PIG-L family deacetylase [Cyanobacteria bacterium J06632_22]
MPIDRLATNTSYTNTAVTKNCTMGTLSMTQWVQQFRQWGVARLLARTNHVIHRQPVQLRSLSPSKILVFAPHNDDETIAAAGTLAKAQSLGCTTRIIFVTGVPQAPDDTLEQTRMAEAQAACTLLGCDYDGWGFTDGNVIGQQAELIREMALEIESFRPDIIFAPFPTDMHRDHQATSLSLAAALQQTKTDATLEIWGYEIWSTLWPNAAVDITDVVAQKRDAIRLYESQIHSVPYEEAAIGLNRYRGLKVGVDYAEAFYVCPPQQFITLAEQMHQL